MDIREALNAAAEKMESLPEPAAETPEPVETSPEPAPAPAEAAPESAPETAERAAERARDERGRFAPKAAEAKPELKTVAKVAQESAKPAPPVEPPKPAVTSPPPPPTHPELRPPQSWRPAVREHWAKLPPEVQAEIVRRESEVPRALQEAAEAKKFREQYQQAVGPYEMLARAAGQDPLAYTSSLLQTAAALQTGTPAQRAQVVANVIRGFGVDISLLDQALQGQPMPQQAQPQMPDPRLVVREEFERLRSEAQMQRAQADLQAFQATNPEFLSDVWDDMQGILELAGKRGRNMTYQEAYDRACKLNEEVTGILAQRAAAKAAGTAQASTQRAMAAASSVRSQPAAAPNRAAQPRSIREALEAASSAISGRV